MVSGSNYRKMDEGLIPWRVTHPWSAITSLAPNTAPPTKSVVSLKARLTELMRTRTQPDGPLYAELRAQRKAKSERVDAELKAMVTNGEARKVRDGRAYRYALVS